MTCDDCRDLMVEALYAELDAATAKTFHDHIASCPACGPEYLGMRQTLSVMHGRLRPEPDARFLPDFWNNLRSRLSVPEMRRPVWRPAAVPAWAYGIAAVLLIAVGVYLGRTLFMERPLPESPPAIAALPEAPADSAETAALAYLGRTKNLLLDFVNRGEGHKAGIDLARRQEVSRQLLRQSTVLTAALDKPDQQLLRQLLLDLEIVLLQLANLEVKPGVPAVELVQAGVDRKSILLKINLEEMRAIARRKPPEVRNPKL